METEKKIYAAMAAIMKSIDCIKKEKKNQQGTGFMYRGIDDVMNNLHTSFAENQVFLTTEVLNRVETERQSKAGGALFYVTQTVKFTFHAIDGSEVSSIIYGTAMDSGDKADNKGLSIALKYCLLQAFLIPTEDMAEPDAQIHEVKTINPTTLTKKDIPTAENKPDTDNRPWMTEKQKDKVIQRIEAGEDGVKENAFKTFRMKKVYREEIKNAGGFSEQFEQPKSIDDVPF